MTQFGLIILGLATVGVCAFASGFIITRADGSWLDRLPRLERTDRSAALRSAPSVEADVRRLMVRFHALPPRTSYVRVEAVRAGFDRALAQYCDARGEPHRLRELTPGPALDAERARVESTLDPALLAPAA